MNFFIELKRRNALLFWFGLFNLAVAVVCLILMPFEETEILGVSRWLKPFKFYSSVGIMVLTMGWLLYYLNSDKKIRTYSWLIVITMFFENGLIIMQAIRNTTSHFNITSTINGIIFNLMGMFILVFTITIILVCISFFKQKQFSIMNEQNLEYLKERLFYLGFAEKLNKDLETNISAVKDQF